MGFDSKGSANKAPDDAQYVVLTTDTDLSDERVLAAGDDLGLTDGGAGGNATLDVANSPTFTAPSTSQLDVTNETLVDATLSSAQSISSGTGWKTVALDNTNKDERGEFDTTNTNWTPDETGWYWVVAAVSFSGEADNDRTHVRVRDTGGSTTLAETFFPNTGGNAQSVFVARLVNPATNAHELQARNIDSSATLQSGARTYLSIRRAFR